MHFEVRRLLPFLKNLISPKLRLIPQVLKTPAKKNYQVNSQLRLKRRIFHSKGRSLRHGASRVAAVLIILGFFLDYQPNINVFPPFRSSIVKADFEQTPSVTPTATPIHFTLPHPGYISTYFSSYHPGIDIASGLGMPVHPIAAGTITSQGVNFWGLGLVVEIDHGNGYKSLYAHLGKTYAKVGQAVTPADTIGEVGLTGNTSGPHTHLEISHDGKNIDPQALLPDLPNIAAAWAGSASGSAELAHK